MSTKPQSLGINKKNFLPFEVMIAGGNKQDREYLIRILVRKEFKIVSTVNDSKEALEELESMENKPDLLFLDYAVHVLAGMMPIKKIRENYPQIKIVVIGNQSKKELIQELVQLKVHSFILKPYDDQTITEKLAHVLGRKDLLHKEDIVVYKQSEIDLKDIKIPSIPTVIMEVLRVNTDDPEVGCRELEKLISPDKSITTNVLRLSNSAFYGRSRKIDNLKDAITLLGVNTVKNLVFLQAKKNLYGSLRDKVYIKFLNEFPILSALISLDLSNPLKLKSLGENLFLFSLLGRIGMSVLALNFPKKYLEVLKFYEFGVKTLIESELDMFTIDSTNLGLKVFKFWKMPEKFIEVLENQNFTVENIQNVSDLDRVTRLSEIFALKLMGVALKEEELQVEQSILQYYNNTKVAELFQEEYYGLIKDHPLYALAMG